MVVICVMAHIWLILQLLPFSLHKHPRCIMCFCFSKTTKKIYHHVHRDISALSLSNWSCFEKASVYTRTDKGKSRFDWLLNNVNRHDKNGALKSALDKHEPGSHQKIAFDIKGFFPRLHLRCTVGGQPLGWVWSVVRLWFREGLGVLAVILWKTNKSWKSKSLFGASQSPIPSCLPTMGCFVKGIRIVF